MSEAFEQLMNGVEKGIIVEDARHRTDDVGRREPISLKRANLRTLVTMILLIGACRLASAQDTVTSYLEEGAAKSLDGEYQDAIRYYTKAIEVEPGCAEAYFLRGNSYDALRDHQDAIDDYTRALVLKPYYPEALFNRGCSYCSLRDYHDAIGDYTKFVELQQDDADGYLNLGYVQYLLGDYRGAINSTKMATLWEPDYSDAYNNLGYIYIEILSLDSAEQSFAKCLELDSTLWQASLGMAVLQFQQGDSSEALKYLATASSFEPRLKEGMSGIAKIEEDGYIYSDDVKQSLRKLFEAAK